MTMTIEGRLLYKTDDSVSRFPTGSPDTVDGRLLYKSDGSVSRFTAGTPDFCGAGCLIVQGIRVPFPTCSVHAMSNFASSPVNTESQTVV